MMYQKNPYTQVWHKPVTIKNETKLIPVVVGTDLKFGTYQIELFKHTLGISVDGSGQIYKVVVSDAEKKIYNPAQINLDESDISVIKELLSIWFDDVGRSKEYQRLFFEGKSPVEIVDGRVLYTDEELSGKTKDELYGIAYDKGLRDYVKISMTADQIKLVILEHQDTPKLAS